jgi:DHA3 family macrolide efflux protein-like MFS transporter
MWYAQIVSTLGDFLALFAIIDIMTFKLHASPQQVTGLNIAYLLPIALLGILSGVFVDRWPLKPTMVSSDFLRAGLCLLLFAVHSVTGFYFVMAAISILSSLFGPAQGVAVRSVVPLNGLRSANALLQQVMMMMRVIGAPIAITIVNIFSAKACYGIDAASFVASGCLIASLSLITPKKPAENSPAKNSSSAVGGILTDMKVGASFIFHHAGLLFVITALAAGMFIMGCFGPLIAIYVRDTLHASSTVFGIVSPSIGVGMLLGVNVLNAAAKKIGNTTQVYLGLGGIALGTLLLSVAPLAAVNVRARSSLGRRVFPDWLRLRRHHCACTDTHSDGNTQRAHGPRWLHNDVLHIRCTDQWSATLRHPCAAHRRAFSLRHLHRHGGRADDRRKAMDGARPPRACEVVGSGHPRY